MAAAISTRGDFDAGALRAAARRPTRRGSARKTRSPAAGPSAERARARQATSERLGLYLRRDLPKGGQRRSPCHAALRHRGDGPASGRDRHANRAPGAHAAILLDQAGWHRSRGLEVPLNITLIPLPAKCPELNPQENVWFKVIRTDRRPLLRRLEQARRSALAHHLHRNARMGLSVLISASSWYQLFEPNCDGGEFDETHEIGEQLVVAGRERRDCSSLLKMRSMILRSL